MTTPEHTLVGIHLSLALGLHRYLGWPAVAMAGVASNGPDWDGLPMLINMQRFEAGHRVWGHNFLVIFFTSLILGATQARYHWLEQIWHRIQAMRNHGRCHEDRDSNSKPSTSKTTVVMAVILFSAIAFLAQAIHLPCDMVVSGGNGLSDWLIQPFWPFSNGGYVYPLIPWGDVGPTVIMMGGIIWIAKNSSRASLISLATIVVLCVYLVARGWFRGAFQ